MPIRVLQIDAFTAEPFAGNPAAVCLLPAPAQAAWMQRVAAEMNLSETAFVSPRPAGDGFDLRWFTPRVEVPLCGHATLAGAHALWEEGLLPSDAPARFHTASGLLAAERADGWIELDFPTDPVAPDEPPPELTAALGVRPGHVARSQNRFLIELDDEKAVRSLRPDLDLIAALPVQGVIVTARAAGGTYDFVSRYFAPRVGIAEDPVTGSAHCSLVPYWAERLGKRELLAYQASERGGTLRLRLAGERVKMGGQAVTVLRGELLA
jgi:PhzF family phenazine biosynthesis protein